MYRAFPPRGNHRDKQLVRLARLEDGPLFESYVSDTSPSEEFSLRLIFADNHRAPIPLAYVWENVCAVHVLLPALDLVETTPCIIEMFDGVLKLPTPEPLQWAYTYDVDHDDWDTKAAYTMGELNMLLQSLLSIDEEEMMELAEKKYTDRFDGAYGAGGASVPSMPAIEGSGASVLIVEDDMTTRLFVMHQAKSSGHKAFGAADGHAALELMEKEEIDIIFVDVGLPDIMGYELTRLLLNRPRNGPPPVVIAFSASDNPMQIAECIKAGCVDYVIKPMKPQELELRIQFAMTKQAFLTTKLVAVAHLLHRHQPEQLLAIRQQLSGAKSTSEYAELALQVDLPLVWLFFNQLRTYSTAWGEIAMGALSALPAEQSRKLDGQLDSGGGEIRMIAGGDKVQTSKQNAGHTMQYHPDGDAVCNACGAPCMVCQAGASK